ncbi:hypothetical protein A3H90_03360 [Candidatus Peribacteria bacterium RIFCSPLOWO2_02_FULL_55_36]|nr:MAG: hypothetical protein A3H90_03360 [Candidatus Peribacteria bacterium RIFCSPLOWO2_02_FULL_55_36]
MRLDYTIPPVPNHLALRSCKIVGLVLFLWILGHIGWQDVFRELRNVEGDMLLLSCIPLILQYVIRALRWHLIVRTAGLQPTFRESWKLFNIGAFLAMITPAKIGELGRAVDLHRQGLNGPTAFALSLIDRIADIIVIAVLATLGIRTLFGTTAMFTVIAIGVALLVTTVLLWKATRKHREGVRWLRELSDLTTGRMVLLLLATTTVGWMCYFWWGIILTRSLGIVIAPFTLIAVLTVTGIVAILPIAPSGLGTRDMALITLLAPHGIAAPRAVALASLMLVTQTLFGTLGAWYWLKTRK